MRPAEAYRLKYRSTSQNSQEQIETETAVARVVESQDLVPTILDYLGVGDAFAPAVTKTWRTAAAMLQPRMSLDTFNGIQASLTVVDEYHEDLGMYGPCSIEDYSTHSLPHPHLPKKARDFFDAKHRKAIWDANPDWKRREVLDEIRKRWANLSNTEGIEYHKLALGEKERYARQEAAHEASELNEDELKGILVGHLPPVIVFFNGNQFAESEWGEDGKWTVGRVFAAIAANEEYVRRGPSDHIFFEGLWLERGAPPPRSLPKKYEAAYVGRHDVHWGS